MIGRCFMKAFRPERLPDSYAGHTLRSPDFTGISGIITNYRYSFIIIKSRDKLAVQPFAMVPLYIAILFPKQIPSRTSLQGERRSFHYNVTSPPDSHSSTPMRCDSRPHFRVSQAYNAFAVLSSPVQTGRS